MKIGVIGSGDVGKVLSAGLKSVGHDIMIGTRDPASGKLDEWKNGDGKGVEVGTFRQAATFGDLIVFVVGWEHAKAALDLADPANLEGKIVLDATNPLAPAQREGEPPVLALGHTDSAGEQMQRWLPQSRVVKWFNIVGNPQMVNPHFGGERPDMMICGNDGGAKGIADKLTQELGWPPVIDLGDIRRSRYLEPMAMVWITYLINNGYNWNHAFKLLRK